MTTSRGPGMRRPGTIAAAVLATVALRVVLGHGPAVLAPLGLVLDVVAALAVGATASRFVRTPHDGRSRRAWVLLTAFPLVWTVAPFVALTGLPDPVAQLARGLAVLLVAGSWWHAARAGGTLSRLRRSVDGAIGLASAVVVAWGPLWSRMAASPEGGLHGAVEIGLAVGMLGVTVLGAGIVLTEMPAGRRARPIGFVTGTFLLAVSDVADALGGPPFWAAAWVAYGLAMRIQPGLTPRVRRIGTRGRQVYLPYALIAPSAVALGLASRDGNLAGAQVVAGLVIVALLLARQHVTLVENDRLVRRLERTEQLLRHRATHDALTGLPGRAALDERLRTACERHTTSGLPVALAFVDVDRFKEVNDRHGHASGDAVLIELAQRLERARSRRGTASFAARLAGDEFALLVVGPAAAAPGTLAATLTEELDGAVVVGAVTVDVRASVGVATPDPTMTGSDLLHAADVAMYEAKRAGRAPVI